MGRECFLCGRTSFLEKHHIFGSSNRKKSEKYGLVVDLCHYCHNEPPYGAHHNKDTMQRVHEYGQRKAMEEQGLTEDEFRHHFGKNYL